jgi:hypothetical protein
MMRALVMLPIEDTSTEQPAMASKTWLVEQARSTI